MKWISLILTLVFVVGCGSADFEAKTAEAGSGSPDEQQEDLVNNPSPERIPLREIENDPTLLDRYACVAGDPNSGVRICHFPEGSGESHTLCIGRAAVDTHYDHYYPESDEYDYLGSCQ